MHSSNPFCTRFFRPGALPYWDTPQCDVDGLMEQLATYRCWGQIVGDHGSGKSTLVCDIQRHLRTRGYDVLDFVYTADRKPKHVARELVSRIQESSAGHNRIQVTLDGFEQLSWYQRRQARSVGRRHGVGLLVTAHRALYGFPVLAQLKLTAELAQRIVHHLVGESAAQFLGQLDFAELCSCHKNNMRDILFDLYDRYSRSATPGPVPPYLR